MAGEGLIAAGPPPLPKWILFLQIGIIVFSLGVLIAAGVNLQAFSDWSGYTTSGGPAAFLVFDAIYTWIVIGSMIALQIWFQKFYYRITYVVTLLISCIFWLSGWAWAADVASAFRSGYLDDGFRYKRLDRYSASIAACAALGAFVWVAIVVLTIFYIMACLKTEGDANYNAEMGVPKSEPITAPAATTAGGPVHQPEIQQHGAYPPQQAPVHQPYPDQYQQSPYPSQGAQGHGPEPTH